MIILLQTLLAQTWYPMTVATNAHVYKQILHHYMNLTHDNTDTLVFYVRSFFFLLSSLTS